MDTIKNILINYWPQILAIILFVLSFILQCIKKKPVEVIDSVTTFITEHAVDVINLVEAMAKGQKYVLYKGVVTSKIDVAIDLMKNKIQLFIPNCNVQLFEHYIRTIIESILSTPQKKVHHEN